MNLDASSMKMMPCLPLYSNQSVCHKLLLCFLSYLIHFLLFFFLCSSLANFASSKILWILLCPMQMPFSSRYCSIITADALISLYARITIFLSSSVIRLGFLPHFLSSGSLLLNFLATLYACCLDIFCTLAIIQTPSFLFSTSLTIHFIFFLLSFFIRLCFTAELILFVEVTLFRDKTIKIKIGSVLNLLRN